VERGGNYGWPCREGAHPLADDDLARCPSKVGLLDPIVEYEHPAAIPFGAVIGGVMYRGTAIPSFVGTYLYGDYATGVVSTMSLDPSTGQPTTRIIADAPAINWVQFAQDLDGEIY